MEDLAKVRGKANEVWLVSPLGCLSCAKSSKKSHCKVLRNENEKFEVVKCIKVSN